MKRYGKILAMKCAMHYGIAEIKDSSPLLSLNIRSGEPKLHV